MYSAKRMVTDALKFMSKGKQFFEIFSFRTRNILYIFLHCDRTPYVSVTDALQTVDYTVLNILRRLFFFNILHNSFLLLPILPFYKWLSKTALFTMIDYSKFTFS